MSFGTWAKSNWLILVLSGVSVVALPTAFYFSSKMHKEMIKVQQTKANKDLSDISTYKVNYSLPSVKQPDQKIFEISAPVNQKLIDLFQTERNKIKAESSKVGAEAVKLNEGVGERQRKPAVAGVLPKYADPVRKNNVQLEMSRWFTQTAYPALLSRVNAGMPPDVVRVAAELTELQTNQKRLMLSSSGSAALTPEQDAALTKVLLEERVNSYRRHAAKLSLFAEPRVISDFPTIGPQQPQPTLGTFWEWQLRYWIHDDLFTAIATANATRAKDAPEGVPGSVVKRVLKVSVEPNGIGDVSDEVLADDPNMVAPTSRDPVGLTPSVSITGRASSPLMPDNQFYDVRKVTIDLIVAPERLPLLFDAIAQTNFMTVLLCQMEEYPIENDIKEGYFYGDEHVVKATITIETLWLRAWTTKYMPEPVKRALAVLEEKKPETEGTEEPPK